MLSENCKKIKATVDLIMHTVNATFCLYRYKTCKCQQLLFRRKLLFTFLFKYDWRTSSL